MVREVRSEVGAMALDDLYLPRFKGNHFDLEVNELDPWWAAIMKKVFPGGVRRAGDPLPVLDVKITIEGIERKFQVCTRTLESIEYRGAIATTVFHFEEVDSGE
jgi:hypothetical protein